MDQEKVFKALSSPRRVKILKVLAKVDKLPVTEVAQKIDLSLKSTSKHLLLLERLSLIKREQKSKWALYSLNKDLGSRLRKLFEAAEKLV